MTWSSRAMTPPLGVTGAEMVPMVVPTTIHGTSSDPPAFAFRVSRFGFRVLGFGHQDQGFACSGIWVSGVRVSGFEIRVSGVQI